MSAQMTDQRIAELLRLRRKVDAELRRLAVASGQAKPKRRSRHTIPECGTESAYQRHRYYGEPKDDACLKAHSDHERDQRAIREARRLAQRLDQTSRTWSAA